MLSRDNFLLFSFFLLLPFLISYAQDTSLPAPIALKTCILPNFAGSRRPDCLAITLAHKGIFDIDIYNKSCILVGWARSKPYYKKSNILTSLRTARGSNWVEVTPQGMQGTLQPRVKYAGKTWGDDGSRGRHDKDSGSWVNAVAFGC
ncbi:hypothetical protein DL98DRAFT_530402 [Cadophora sp. DSE1049]|nr:hypothetical protein DL98DRAFT_530402 [Cadophora sp. DSE1049]